MRPLQRWYTALYLVPGQPARPRLCKHFVRAYGELPSRGLVAGVLLIAFSLLLGSSRQLLAQQGTTPAPTTPTPFIPANPLEPIPSSSERLLVPIPERFNWLQRDVRSNPLLDSLVGTLSGAQGRQGPSQLLLSVTLGGEYSDNFFSQREESRDDYRARATLGTVYRVDADTAFLSLANTVSATYRGRTEETDFGYTNLSLNAGYDLPRVSFGLSESFVRDDNSNDEGFTTSSRALRRGSGFYLRNQISPQVRYELSRVTSLHASYTNIITRDESGFTNTLNTPVLTSTRGNSTSHIMSAGVNHAFSAILNAALQYTFTYTNDESSRDSITHDLTANTAYRLTEDTSATLRVFGRSTDRQNRNGTDSSSYGFSIGVRHVLLPTLAVNLAIGPTFLSRDGTDQRLLLNWQASLDGYIPIFETRETILTLSTNQGVDDTTGDVDSVGLVLRQAVAINLSHSVSSRLRTSFYANYTRTEPLEIIAPTNDSQTATDNFWSAGARATYILTPVISLNADYRYQRRDSTRARDDFDENRVTVSVSGNLPVF